jgi:peptidoglycan L-alanyl-D-glutamate endopeptidase CwlK
MTYALGEKSRRNLVDVHPKLVRVVERAIEITTQDFTVHEGIRSLAQQRINVKRGVSWTLESKHLKQLDGFGHAVDLVPIVGGKPVWEWEPIYHVAAAVRQAARELEVALRWGGVWDKAFLDLPATPEGLKRAVADYVSRRRAKGLRASIDGPHWELTL